MVIKGKPKEVKQLPVIVINYHVDKEEVEEPDYLKVKPRDRTKDLYVSRELPSGITGRFKSYMDYRAITNKSSTQWKMQQDAITDDEGFRKYDGKYMVAVGSYYADRCGKLLKVTLDSGIVIHAIVGDLKQDRHTDSTNRYVTTNGNILEFIVDTKKLCPTSKKMGDVSYSGLQGSIIKIEEEKR